MRMAGFSLIEIVIALMVSSFVALMLYRALYQTTRIVQRINILVDDHADLLPLRAQLEQDLSGVWKPTKKRVGQKVEDQPKGKQEPGKKPIEQKKEPQKEAGEIRAFYVQKKGDITEKLSCITTHAFSVINEPVMYLAQVTYKLVPQKDDYKKLFTLVRDEQAYDPGSEGEKTKGRHHSYPLLTNVSKWSVKLTVFAEEKTREMAAKSSKDVKKRSLGETLTLTEWGTDEQHDKVKRSIPDFVHITGAVYNSKTQKETSFVFDFAIPCAACQDMESQVLPGEKGGLLEQVASSAFSKVMEQQSRSLLGSLPPFQERSAGAGL